MRETGVGWSTPAADNCPHSQRPLPIAGPHLRVLLAVADVVLLALLAGRAAVAVTAASQAQAWIPLRSP